MRCVSLLVAFSVTLCLSAPAQAPVVNGPMSQPTFRGLTGIGQ